MQPRFTPAGLFFQILQAADHLTTSPDVRPLWGFALLALQMMRAPPQGSLTTPIPAKAKLHSRKWVELSPLGAVDDASRDNLLHFWRALIWKLFNRKIKRCRH